MKIIENIDAIDLALYLKKQNTLILSDLHLGFEKELHTRGILVPPFQFKEIKERLENIFSVKDNFDGIIINGDLKHEFGRISNQEWDEILELISILEKHCKKIIIIKGQHDVILDRIANKKNIKLKGNFFKNGIFITHGHKIPETKTFKEAKFLIIGNEHPAISISDETRTETYKCFLKGKYKNKTLIVQPSFCLATEGTDILKEQFISPFLQGLNLENFEAFVLAPSFNEIKYFGKLKNL